MRWPWRRNKNDKTRELLETQLETTIEKTLVEKKAGVESEKLHKSAREVARGLEKRAESNGFTELIEAAMRAK